MAPGIGAAGILGIAIESTPGTYAAPTKFVPFISESLTSTQATIWRRPIRQSASIIGAVPGNFHVEGELQIEAMEDIVPYFLYAGRHNTTKTGTTPNFTYTFTPTADAIPTKTLSITTVRNGVVFGFVGCVVASFTFTVEDGIMMMNLNILGQDEATQSVPTPTWPTTTPFGAGQYSVEIPTGSPVQDTDNFEFSVDNSAEPQFRLQTPKRGAQFIKYGERSATINFDRDFESRSDFDSFKALTAQSITVTASKTPDRSISLVAPVAIKDTYEVQNSGQGDLVRASISYQCVVDPTGKDYQITVKTDEDFTP